MYDCHLHTKYSFDGKNEMAEVCEISLQHGMKGLCFTDHVDLAAPNPHSKALVDYVPDMAAYKQDFDRVKRQYGNSLALGRGIEIGLQPGLQDRNLAEIAKAQPDFIIGSIHYIDGMDIYHGNFSRGKTERQAYLAYLEHILQMVKAHSYFHVLGHLDMILRDDTFPERSFDKPEYHLLIDDILRELIVSGRGIEVNSSGWRYHLPGPHPAPFIIKRYYQLGGRIITTGSDSHYANSVNLDIDRATEILRQIGFKTISFFLKGKEERKLI